MQRNVNYGFSRINVSFVAIFALFISSFPAYAQSNDPLWVNRLHTEMQRLTDIGWRVRKAAGVLCPEQANGIGAAYDYIGAYPPASRESLRSALGLGELPQIAAVAAGSPAADAGLQPGDEIKAVNGEPITDLIAKSANADLFADELELIMAKGTPGTPVSLTIRHAGENRKVTVAAVPICAARFVYKLENPLDAYADPEKRDVAVTSGMIAFNADDAALAMVMAHELGHIIRNDGKANGIRDRRMMEDRADMIGGGLVRCAGYDLDAATEFYRHYNRRDLLRWFRDPSHRSMSARAKRVSATPTGLSCPLTPDDLAKLVATSG